MFETFIARRYLSTRHKPPFVSLILSISLLSVGVGVFSLIFVLSVMNGFERDFRSRILNFRAPLTVLSTTGEDLSERMEDFRAADPRIRKLVPFAEGEAVAQTEEGGVLGLRLRGLGEAPDEARLGRYYASEAFGEDSVVLGDELAAALHAHPDFPEELRIIFPLGDVGPSGEVMPRVRLLKLTGIFHSGFYDYDSKYALAPYAQALRLFGEQARTGLEVWVEPRDAADAVRAVLEAKGLKNLRVETWREANPKLFAATKLEKIGMFLLLGMLLLIAAFNIYGLVSLTVLDKTKDMAVLRAVGLSAARVRRIFLWKSAAIGFIGTASGGALGLLAAWLLTKYPVPLPASYYIEHLPVAVEPSDVVTVLLLVPFVTFLAALYPARQAGRVSPVEALRYE
ncbi:MAG TPA: FtsX-like permease family protein [bacterium]|nr:FtsX-like permease family protein [bacterium]